AHAGRGGAVHSGGTASLFGVVLALAGCAVGPKFTAPEAPVPPGWREGADARVAKQAEIDTRWWRTFDDATLDRLIEHGYHKTLPLQIAGLRIVEARAQLAIATGKQYPQTQELFANGNAVGLSQNVAQIGNLPRNYFSYQLGFDAAWEID